MTDGLHAVAATPVTIALVAGELSGDTLGASLMRDLRQLAQAAGQTVGFIGIGGAQMQAEGLQPLGDMERLAVMGIAEVAGRLRELLALRDQLVSQFVARQVCLFVGIDAPDFNLRLALPLRQQGIRTVQYVSPSVWAWRQGRVKAIAAAVDRVLCLFPFEPAFYARHQVDAVYVGHPLVRTLTAAAPQPDQRQQWGLRPAQPVMALLPGSRRGEIERLGSLFLQVAGQLHQRYPDWQFITAAANPQRQQQLQQLIDQAGLPVTIIPAQDTGNAGRIAMQLADVVLLASGTASFEAMLLDRPQVIAYQVHWLTYWLVRWLIRIPYVGLPNILAGRELVPERIQGQASVASLTEAVTQVWQQPELQRQAFAAIRAELAVEPGRAAEAVWSLIGPVQG